MTVTTKRVRYGVANAAHYTESNAYIGDTRTPQEAVAELADYRRDHPNESFRIFKCETVEVTTDVTNELV